MWTTTAASPRAARTGASFTSSGRVPKMTATAPLRIGPRSQDLEEFGPDESSGTVGARRYSSAGDDSVVAGDDDTSRARDVGAERGHHAVAPPVGPGCEWSDAGRRRDRAARGRDRVGDADRDQGRADPRARGPGRGLARPDRRRRVQQRHGRRARRDRRDRPRARRRDRHHADHRHGRAHADPLPGRDPGLRRRRPGHLQRDGGDDRGAHSRRARGRSS